MRKRLLTTLAVLAVLLAGGYLLLRLTAPRHNITQEGFKAIRIGMTRAEVEVILGVPPGDYGKGAVEWELPAHMDSVPG